MDGAAGEHFGPIAARRSARAARRAARRALHEFRDAAGANLAPLLRDELWPVVGYYEELKQRAGVLDFLDLLLVARDLVRDNAAVRAELQHRFTHIFVDEFQDTDPLQAEILLLLAADDPAETNWHRRAPAARQAVYRRRSEAIDLSLSPRRRRALPGAQAPAAEARRRARTSDRELSRDARNSRRWSTPPSRR